MAKILISLVSEQTIPNVLFIREMNGVEKYIFVSTDQMERKGKTEMIISGSHIKGVPFQKIEVSEDSLEDIAKKLDDLKFDDDDEFIVNLTGGTKIMSIGVYNFFTSRRADIYYLPIGKNIYKRIFSHRVFDLGFRISLNDYLTSYGINVIHKGKLQKDKGYTCDFFTRFINNRIDPKLIDELRKRRGRKIKKDDITGLEAFLRDIRFDTEELEFIGKREIDYLTGGWFEEYVFATVKDKLHLKDDKIGFNIHISRDNTQNEFDVMFVCENALYVIECKTSLNSTSLLNALYKLSALKKDFGLWVKSYLFTLDDLRDSNGNIKEVYEKRASLLGIKLVDRVILKDKKEINGIF